MGSIFYEPQPSKSLEIFVICKLDPFFREFKIITWFTFMKYSEKRDFCYHPLLRTRRLRIFNNKFFIIIVLHFLFYWVHENFWSVFTYVSLIAYAGNRAVQHCFPTSAGLKYPFIHLHDINFRNALGAESFVVSLILFISQAHCSGFSSMLYQT